MALVDRTNFHINKENAAVTNSKKIGMDLEEKMQKPMKSDVQPIKTAVSSFIAHYTDVKYITNS